jgi:hypothetical protein
MNNIVKKYDTIFLDNHINDTINLLLTFSKYELPISYQAENAIHNSNLRSKDPLMMASYLLYSKYDSDHFKQVLSEYNSIIYEALGRISSAKDYLMYSELWYVMIFNKCPFIDTSLQNEISRIINDVCSLPENPQFIERDKTRLLFAKFLRDKSDNFITWKLDTIDIVADITFRTRHRTIFRNFGKASNIYDVSV